MAAIINVEWQNNFADAFLGRGKKNKKLADSRYSCVCASPSRLAFLAGDVDCSREL